MNAKAKKKAEETQQYHFFFASFIYWTTDVSLADGLRKQRDKDRKGSIKAPQCAVFKVPVPVNESYKIDEFAPQVEGAVLIHTETY